MAALVLHLGFCNYFLRRSEQVYNWFLSLYMYICEVKKGNKIMDLLGTVYDFFLRIIAFLRYIVCTQALDSGFDCQHKGL